MAADGFHPGAVACASWAAQTADALGQRLRA